MKKRSTVDASCTGVFLLAVGFCTPLWATGSGYNYNCVNPGATNYAGTPLPDGASSYQSVTGRLETCPSGQIGCAIDFTKGQTSCNYTVTAPDGVPVTVTINTLRAGIAKWSAQCKIGGEVVDCKGVALVDGVTTTDASKYVDNSCLYNFGVDAASGSAGFSGRTIGKLRACSDGIYERIPEPLPEPATVAGCFIASGQSKVIDGVTVQCPTVPVGEQRTIVVVSDTVTDGGQLVVPEGFGFTNSNGDIDFGNLCVCIGGDEVPPTALECAPTTAYQDKFPELNLPLCEVGQGSRPVTELQIQNPVCVVVGGSRRCY